MLGSPEVPELYRQSSDITTQAIRTDATAGAIQPQQRFRAKSSIPVPIRTAERFIELTEDESEVVEPKAVYGSLRREISVSEEDVELVR
jgi:hypothetical protein